MRKQQQPQEPPVAEPEKFERWTAQRKAAIILEVLKGQISVPEAARRYGFTQGEYRKWADEFIRGGVDALKVNRKGLDAEHRAEVRRLQSKIGQLVMENEIAKEALRIIPLDESEQHSIDLLLGKASRASQSAES
jgi:transposase-like protein